MLTAETLLEAVLNGLALSMFFEVDNYIGAAAITMAGGSFSRYYQPHVLLQKSQVLSISQHARSLLRGETQASIQLALRRAVGLWFIFYGWTELVYIPIFSVTFVYSPTKNPLDSCSWTPFVAGVIADFRATLLLFTDEVFAP